MPKTRLTKTGEPAMNTTIELHITADDPEMSGWWEPAKIVGKGWSKGVPRRLIMVVVEWPDGERGTLWDFDDVVWRTAQIDGGDRA